LREVFFRVRAFARLERPDDRFLAVRRRAAAFRFGAFAFLPRAVLFRGLARFFVDAGRFLGGAGGGVGV